MLANVSPASYRPMIAGQSCWGIFPLLLDFSMQGTLGCNSCVLSSRIPARTIGGAAAN
jgi:hypothetical protein